MRTFRFSLVLAVVSLFAACAAPTGPSQVRVPDRPSLDADKGSCNPNDTIKDNHCSSGGPHNPGNSNPNP